MDLKLNKDIPKKIGLRTFGKQNLVAYPAAVPQIREKYPCQHLTDEQINVIKNLPLTDLKVTDHFDPNLVILEIGNQQTLVLPKAALANFSQSFAIASKDYEPRSLDMYALRDMKARNITTNDFMCWPANLLQTMQLASPLPKIDLKSLLVVIDTAGDIVSEGEAGTVFQLNVDTVPILGYAVIARRFNTRYSESVANVVFNSTGGNDVEMAFELNGDVGAFVALNPLIINQGAFEVAVAAGPIGTLGETQTALASSYHFSPFDILLGGNLGGDAEFSGVNINLTIYPIVFDESVKSAIITAVAANKIQHLADFMVDSLLRRTK